MRKTFYILSLLLVLFVGCQSEERALYSKLTKMASELNESTPVMLDQYTRFDGASVLPGNIFQYQYTVLNTNNPDSLVQKGLESLRSNIKNELSTNPQLVVFRENNVVLEYVYMNEDQETIRSLKIEPEDYLLK